MVQEVESFGPELEVDRFGQVCPLHDREIVIGLEWSSENIPSDVTKRSETCAACRRAANNLILVVNAAAGRDERIEIDEVIDSLSRTTARQYAARTDSSAAAIDEIGVLKREGAEIDNQEGCARLECAHTVNGPAIRELAWPTAQPLGKRKLVVIADYKPVRSIEV